MPIISFTATGIPCSGPIGLPDFFKPKPIALPNIIPIEIINVSETTSIAKKTNNENKEPVEKKLVKQKKFNASENVEIKKMEIQKNPEIIFRKPSFFLAFKNLRVISFSKVEINWKLFVLL